MPAQDDTPYGPALVYIVNVEVAVVRDGMYLATTRSAEEEYGAGWVGFPGGKVDLAMATANILEVTAHREVQEEVGLALDTPLVYVESHSFGSPTRPVLDVVMLARSLSGEPHNASPDEVAAVRWLSYDEMMRDPNVQPWTKASLQLVEAERLARGW